MDDKYKLLFDSMISNAERMKYFIHDQEQLEVLVRVHEELLLEVKGMIGCPDDDITVESIFNELSNITPPDTSTDGSSISEFYRDPLEYYDSE